jgi:hypothetical protein
MNKRSFIVLMIAGVLCASCAAGILVGQSDNRFVTFVSDRSWATTSPAEDVGAVGIPVCLNDLNPSPCAAGARNYDYPSAGWEADLSSIPGALWMWGFRETRGDPGEGLAEVAFRKVINLPGRPLYGSFLIAVDDEATVIINGHLAGTAGSGKDVFEASRAQASLKQIDIQPFLKRGNNEIMVIARNGPASFAVGSNPDHEHPNGETMEFGRIPNDPISEKPTQPIGVVSPSDIYDHMGKRGRDWDQGMRLPRGEPASKRNPAGVVFGGWMIVVPGNSENNVPKIQVDPRGNNHEMGNQDRRMVLPREEK